MSDKVEMSTSALEPATALLCTIDGFDPLVVNPGRLSILTALATASHADGREEMEFIELRRRTRLTDGNLACHARRLADGGLIEISKHFREGKSVTTYILREAGKAALQSHVQNVMATILAPRFQLATLSAPPPNPSPAATSFIDPVADSSEDDWVD